MSTNLTATLIAAAAATKAAYPQYDGHFDNYVAVRCVRDVKSRGRTVCEKGEWVLVNPASAEPAERGWAGMEDRMPKYNRGKTFATFYLPKNLSGIDTSLRTDYFDLTGVTLTERPGR